MPAPGASAAAAVMLALATSVAASVGEITAPVISMLRGPMGVGVAWVGLRAVGTWFARGGWYFLVHLLSLGMLAPVPFVHAASRTGRTAHKVSAVLYLVLTVAAFVLIDGAPEDAAGNAVGPRSDLGSSLIVAILVVGFVHLIYLRPQVFPGAPRALEHEEVPDPAVSAVLRARHRREEARRIAADDIPMARELRIGRPDLPRTYDDGGLVDLNTVPAAVLARVLGVAEDVAERLVGAREAAGHLESVEDVFAFADLPYEAWDVIRERAIVFPS